MLEVRSKNPGVFQLEDGNWGYRFIVTVTMHLDLLTQYDCFGVIRCALIAAKHTHIEKERKQLLVNVMKENFYYRADRLLELMKKYL